MGFDQFYIYHLAPVEGGYSDDPVDAGGRTWFGVSSAYLSITGRSGPLTREQAEQIMYTDFWCDLQLDQCDPVVAWCYSDARVQHRPVDADKLLQRALEVKVDGRIGPMTRQAMAHLDDPQAFWARYRTHRLRLYLAIVEKHPEQRRFLAGWLFRVHHLHEAMLHAGLFDESMFRRWCQSQVDNA